MANVADTKNVVNRNVLKKRPDGTDPVRYRNIGKWSYHQWAWELLRRYDKYIDACKMVRDGKKSKQVVARDFGLKKFKHYSESYSKQSGYPQFSIESPFIWKNLDASNHKAHKIKLYLRPGQMIIRLDFDAAIKHKGAIDKQVSKAINKIKENAAEFKMHNQAKIKPHTTQVHTFGIYIRLLDLKAARKSNLECAKIILKSKVQDGVTNHFLREDIKQRLRSARKIAEENYKYLSVRDGTPTEGTQIPIEL